jgi:hypothetical protein
MSTYPLESFRYHAQIAHKKWQVSYLGGTQKITGVILS